MAVTQAPRYIEPMRDKFNFSFDIVFSEPQEIAGRRVVDVLGQFSGRVSDIIGLFDSP